MTETQQSSEIQKDEQAKKELATLANPMTQLAMTRRGFEPNSIEAAWRYGQALAQSELVPVNYRNKPGSCVIAIDLAMRLNSSWLMVMQHVYDVKGRISMDAQFATALMNQSGLFTDPLEYEEIGDNPAKDDYAVRAYAKRKRTGKVLYGPWITWTLVKAEGWHNKDGSKWKTMPDQMFHYRAASWFANRHCPEVKMGMMTTDEASELTPVTFAEAKQISSTQIDADLGSEPVGVQFENDHTEPESPPAKDKRGRKLAAKTDTPPAEDKPLPVFRYVCSACGLGFDDPRMTGPGNGVKSCPGCTSIQIHLNPANAPAIEDYR